MTPWVERPTITLDLARVRRGEPPDLPAQAVASSKALLGEVMASIPPKARFLAYLLSVGHPADRPLRVIRRPNRRPFEEVVHRERW